MYLKGVKVRKSSSIGFRDGNPEIDKDLKGRPVDYNYVAFVRYKDCDYTLEDGIKYVDLDTAPCIPVGYGATNYGYGKSKKVRGIFKEYTSENEYILYGSYYQTPFYIAYKGDVYVGSVYSGVEGSEITGD